MSTISSVSSTASSSTTSSTTASTMLGQDAFLEILMTQLQYQDPLDPMETNEFMSELAQLTQVEVLNNISTSLDSLISANESSGLSRWSDLIGKSIYVDGNEVSYGDSIEITPSGDYESIVLNLTNSDGTVTQQTLSKSDALTLTYSGTDDVTVSAYGLNASGNTVSCTVGVYQTVTGIQSSDSGFVAVTSHGDQYDVSTITKVVG